VSEPGLDRPAGSPLLSVRGLSKAWPGVRALDQVDLDVQPGEIHALLGENGAGKSTLIKILAGAVSPDAGAALLAGEELTFGDPLAARRRGIGVIYQELTLVPQLSAAANVFLGREKGGLVLDLTGMERRAQEVLDSLGGHVPASARVDGLSVAQQQIVEIARALVERSRVLILDEPTSALTGEETERLFTVLRGLREQGLAILYISHRLEEVFALADRVTVLRDGRKVAQGPASGFDRASLIRAMVGREMDEEFPPRSPRLGEVVLEAQGLSSPGLFAGVSLSVRRGEIVGVAGLVGAGRTSLGLALAGALPVSGEIRIDGVAAHLRSPRAALQAGIAYVTEERKARGLFPALSAGTNITISHLRELCRLGVVDLRREAEAATRAAREFDLRAASLEVPAATLSGGNQQKLLLARYLLGRLRVLILDEPTRGIDVGARAEIYRLMNGLTDRGLGIVMISSELPEVLALADRVLVLHEGRLAGALDRLKATPERVLDLATGGR
jgi:ABC-type sugar transport system ATPase subunit